MTQVKTTVPPLLNEEQFAALIDCMESMAMSASEYAYQIDARAEIDKLRELIATPTVRVHEHTLSGAQVYCSGGDK